MNPVIKSFLTSVLKDILTGLGGILVTGGYLAKTQETEFVTMGTGAALVAISQLVSWYKARQVTQQALISAVNKGDNGVKVVSAESTAPMVTEPKGVVK